MRNTYVTVLITYKYNDTYYLRNNNRLLKERQRKKKEETKSNSQDAIFFRYFNQTRISYTAWSDIMEYPYIPNRSFPVTVAEIVFVIHAKRSFARMALSDTNRLILHYKGQKKRETVDKPRPSRRSQRAVPPSVERSFQRFSEYTGRHNGLATVC